MAKKKKGQPVKTFSPATIAKQLAKQKAQRKLAIARKRATVARNVFRVRKSDKGKFVFIGVDGKRNPQSKGRKGHLIYVTKSGKKWLTKHKGKIADFKPRTLSETEPPINRNLGKAAQRWQKSRLVRLKSGSAATKGKGKVKSNNQWDFSDKTVSSIAGSLKKTIEGQASRRVFLINAMILCKTETGELLTFEISVPIAKPDHISIEKGGLENFVRMKFYAFLAKELAAAGYVTSGSANHVGRLRENRGEFREDWTKDGMKWEGADREQLRIVQIDWTIDQAV